MTHITFLHLFIKIPLSLYPVAKFQQRKYLIFVYHYIYLVSENGTLTKLNLPENATEIG